MVGVCADRIGTVQTTAHYAHLGRDSVKAAAALVADSPSTDLETSPASLAVR